MKENINAFNIEIHEMSYYVCSDWSIGVLRQEPICKRDVLDSLKYYFMKAMEHFCHVYKVSSKHWGSWENSRKLRKPETSRVCITVS